MVDDSRLYYLCYPLSESTPCEDAHKTNRHLEAPGNQVAEMLAVTSVEGPG